MVAADLKRRPHKNRRAGISRGLLLLAAILIVLRAGPAPAEPRPLWLSLAAGPQADDCCLLSGAPAAAGVPASGPAAAEKKPLPGRGRPATASGSGGGRRGGSGQVPARFESEHRPLPVRSYYLNTPDPKAELFGLLRRADGTLLPIEPLREAGQVKLSYPAVMGKGPMHGPNHLYAVERHLEGDTLVVRVAKWCTLHHNCGWGHEHKFDEERLTARGCAQVPFEIVAHDLWDGNFHSRVMTGDRLHFDLLYQGRPAPGAKVRFTTEKGWSREATADEAGRVSMQLIRDLYPASWPLFDRNQQGELRVVAHYLVTEAGHFAGRNYQRIELSTTFPWRYYPARREYTSLASGLFLVTLALAVSGLGIYLHRARQRRPRREIVFDED